MLRKKVLYAEDEYTNRLLLKMYLERYGIDVDMAADGIEAIEMCKKKHYDLVILDQYMPGMNGDEVGLELRKDFPDIPLVAITSDDTEKPKLLSSGFQEVLIKPIRNDTYAGIVERYLKH